ncbi:MAG: pyruvate ferredoxin oxidoreductase [Prevotella sp.]|nr:pyruvate ferredoxin oxidoreductase [Prevotella sp.]
MIQDYKYIEQLLEAYFNGETTIEEEKILRTFFCQEELPKSMVQYRELFVYEQTEPQTDRLSADFDAKIMQLIADEEAKNSTKVVKFAKVSGMTHSVMRALQPFFRAAAVVAVVITIGTASQALFNDASREQTGVAKIETQNGKNMADVQLQNADSLKADTLKVFND